MSLCGPMMARKLLEKAKSEGPELIISSLSLPKVSGLDLVREIRSGDKKTPIMVIGELEERETIIQALKYGVNDFLTKPFKPVELVLRVQHILGNY